MSNQRSYERAWVIRTWFEHGRRDVPGAINAAGLYGIEFCGRAGAGPREFCTDLPAEKLAKNLHVFGAGMLVTAKAVAQEEADASEIAEFALRLLS